MDTTWPKKVADSFWFAATRNLEQRRLSPTQFQSLLIPGVVCLAFAVELGMKAMISRNSAPKKTHDLSRLFSQLPQEVQEKLVAASGKPQVAFDNSLKAAATIFEDWRYVYELENPQVDLEFLTKLADATRLATDEYA
jgi:hypothetical protein